MRTFTERQADLAAAKAAVDRDAEAKLSEIQRQFQETKIAARAKHDELEANAKSEHDAFDAKLAKKVVNDLVPLLKRFPNESRATATDFAAKWREHCAAAVEYLGEPVDVRLMIYAFGAAEGLAERVADESICRFDAVSSPGNAINRIRLAIESGGAPAEVEARMREAEAAISTALRKARAYPDRSAAMCSRATSRGIRRVVEDVARSEARAVHDENLRNWPKPNRGSHLYRGT